jgi:hypothetical protein
MKPTKESYLYTKILSFAQRYLFLPTSSPPFSPSHLVIPSSSPLFSPSFFECHIHLQWPRDHFLPQGWCSHWLKNVMSRALHQHNPPIPYVTASQLHGWITCNHFKHKIQGDCAYTTWAIPPHPLMQSRSMDDNSACEITSNSSPGPFNQNAHHIVTILLQRAGLTKTRKEISLPDKNSKHSHW